MSVLVAQEEFKEACCSVCRQHGAERVEVRGVRVVLCGRLSCWKNVEQVRKKGGVLKFH